MRTTRGIKTAVTTAERALAAGNLDTARRAVVYGLQATGARKRLGFAPPADAEALRLCLEIVKTDLYRIELENARARGQHARVAMLLAREV